MALGGLTGATPGPPRTRAVLLDALGTLVALKPPWPALVEGLACDHGVDVSLPEAERAVRGEMDYYRRHHREGRDPASLHALRLRCAHVLRDELPAAAQGVATEALLPTLLGALRFCAYPDAEPALRDLRRAGLRLAVVSNWDVSLPEVLARVGLVELVDDVVTSAAAGSAKPDPAIFGLALERVGVAADRALHVGDSVEHDVAGARAAHIAPVLIRRERETAAPPPGVPVIASLSEVGELLTAGP